MKQFITVITFLFLTVFVNAQLNMEEISYIPSTTGHYDNLIVKGNVYIKDLITAKPFDIQSYGSLLTLRTNTNHVYIHNLTMTGNNRTMALSSQSSNLTSTIMTNPLAPGETNPTNKQITPFTMHGGSLSIATANGTAVVQPVLLVESIAFYPTSGITPTYNIRTQNLNITDNIYVQNEGLYLMGMKVPYCIKGYVWADVTVSDGTKPYSVLACPK